MTHILNGLFGSIGTWWSDLFFDHRLLAVSVRFLHLGALVLSGGAALLTDRRILAASRGGIRAQESVLSGLPAVHRQVVAWLGVVFATGLLLTVADAEVFLTSTIFWLKMGLVALLLVNGVFMLKAERRTHEVGTLEGWKRLRVGAASSTALWIILLFMGTLLQAAA